ncbi:MAG: MFS transporter [Bryobacteraceae bacterium]
MNSRLTTAAASIWVKTTITSAPVIYGQWNWIDDVTERFTIAKFRWIIAGMLLISTTINYTDRVTLSVPIGDVRRSLSLGEADYGQIVSLFMFSYAIMYAGSGYVVDRLGARRGFAVFAFLWSVAQMLHGLVVGKWSLAGCRFLLGLAEPGNFPAAVKVVREWFPETQRALGVGIFNAGSSLGAAVASPLAAWLGLVYGWRAAFVFTGALGLVWLAFWLLLYQPPALNPWITQRQRVIAANASPVPKQTASLHPPWRNVLGSRACLILMLVRFLSDPVIYFVIFWLPAYLEKERGFSLGMVGRYAWTPYVFGDIGYVLGGWLSGWLIEHGWSLPKSRKCVMALGACLMPAAIAAPLVPSAEAALAAMCGVVLGHAIWIANLMTLPADLFSDTSVATATGFCGMAGSLGGALANLATGYVVSRVSYSPVFVFAAVAHPISMAILFAFLPARLFLIRSNTLRAPQFAP